MGHDVNLASQDSIRSQRIRLGEELTWAKITVIGIGFLGAVYFTSWQGFRNGPQREATSGNIGDKSGLEIHGPKPTASSPYGRFPQTDDPFRFIPCTRRSVLPPLDDDNAPETWAALFDPNPHHWSWGSSGNTPVLSDDLGNPRSSRRGIYLCGYLDLPLDYTNHSDRRIVRLAVTKYQVSGLARIDSLSSSGSSPPPAGAKSKRTIVVEPGGPGESGTAYIWKAAEDIAQRYGDGRFDVLGWDPRGVNGSLPTAACVPHDFDRDKWVLLRRQYREVSVPETQLKLADAMNDAIFHACRERLGDFGRFIGTGMVARDLDEIRKTLGEEQLTGFFISYGTGIAQTYANMFPERVGRMVLDGVEYVKDHRLLGGFGWTSLDNATDVWRDGFLRECLRAGPELCALAKPAPGEEKGLLTAPSADVAALRRLEVRMHALLQSLIEQPLPVYTDATGPSLILYSTLVLALYVSMYDTETWPATAQLLYDLERGNATTAALRLDESWWYKPTQQQSSLAKPSSAELPYLVVCADASDAEEPKEGLAWWDRLWANMAATSWLAGNSRFLTVQPCRHFRKYWPDPVGLYRGNLNHSLSTPLLLIGGVYDPATPLRNARRLFQEMGTSNARLVVHHGYGHVSRAHRSRCTDALARAYLLEGSLPEAGETQCYPDGGPYDVASPSA